MVSPSRLIAIVDFVVIANADARDKAASSDGDEEDEQDGNETTCRSRIEGERLPPKHCELNERSGNGHSEHAAKMTKPMA